MVKLLHFKCYFIIKTKDKYNRTFTYLMDEKYADFTEKVNCSEALSSKDNLNAIELKNGHFKMTADFLNDNFTIVGWITLNNMCVTFSLGSEISHEFCMKSKHERAKSQFIVLDYDGAYLKIFYPDADILLSTKIIQRVESFMFEGSAILSGFKMFNSCLKYQDRFTEYAFTKPSIIK